MIKLFILTEDDGTPCDRCGRVKAALVEAGVEHEVHPLAYEGGSWPDEFFNACRAVDMHPGDFVAAPVMFCGNQFWEGEDCFVAIEEREWE